MYMMCTCRNDDGRVCDVRIDHAHRCHRYGENSYPPMYRGDHIITSTRHDGEVLRWILHIYDVYTED